MKNICKFCVYGFLGFAILLMSCKKDKEQDPISILTSKTWKYSAVDRTLVNNLDLPFNMVPDCEKDNTFEFKKDGKLNTYNNVMKYNVDETSTKESNYSYNKETKELLINGFKCIVISLTKDQLKYKAPIAYQTGYVFVIIILE